MRTKHSIPKTYFKRVSVSVSMLCPIWHPKSNGRRHTISMSLVPLRHKDKRRCRAYCSLANSFGPSSVTLALLTGWSMGQEAENLKCTSIWFLPIFSCPGISTVVMRAPYQVFLRVCFKILLSWTASFLITFELTGQFQVDLTDRPEDSKIITLLQSSEK